jgi:cobalt-zinc-cadmium efflux system outer membrane protein
LVARENPTLRALKYRRLAARGQLQQASLWSNPELEAEIEEFGWNAPGLSESEFTISLSQEFELFGQRGARQNVARREIVAVEFESNVEAFDLYLEVKRRFYRMAHAQEKVRLAEASVELADDIVENISFRIDRGAGLQSELLLAEIEQQRVRLQLEELRQQGEAAEARLVALWNGMTDVTEVVADKEPELRQLLEFVDSLPEQADSTRMILHLQNQAAILRAQQSLSEAETRPTLTISGGVKRSEADGSKSFLVGMGLPLPLFNRNQGNKENLRAQTRTVEYEIERERLEVSAAIKSHVIELRNTVQRHDILDSQLLPKAERAYRSLQKAYESGRLPYTQMLEAERSLVELRFEHNDILLSLHEQVIELEALTGVVLPFEQER